MTLCGGLEDAGSHTQAAGSHPGGDLELGQLAAGQGSAAVIDATAYPVGSAAYNIW